jgi:membrane fusion protein (multidrug efflux system)
MSNLPQERRATPDRSRLLMAMRRTVPVLAVITPMLISLSISLQSCTEQKAAQEQKAPAKTEVSVMALHPQSVAITAEVPGRTAASLVAEVRPQVSGIIRARNFKEGSEVKAGDTLYEIDPSAYQAAYDSANAALQKTEGAVPSAQAKVDRYNGLSTQSAVSKQDLDDARSTLVQAQADVAAAKAALETARISLGYTKILAPISGRIDASSVTVGALVTAEQTTALATINQLDPINVDVTQSSTNLLALRRAAADGRLIAGDNVSVKLKLEDGSKYPQPGSFAFAEASISETVGTFTARAVFPNPDRLILPGMYVRATIEEGVAPNSYLVPQRSVTRNTKGQATAFFVAADGKVQQRILAVQRSIGNSWLVGEGIADGDRVVVEGLQNVRDGQEVKADEVTVNDDTGELSQTTSDKAGADKQAENTAIKSEVN